MLRRTFLALALARPASKRRAVRFLLDNQSADGAWHSTTYGLLRSGQSLTPQVLLALLNSSEPMPQDRVEKAAGFIRANIDPEGALGRTDPFVVDYPNYATSLAVRALIKAKKTGWRPMLEYLKSQQFIETNGWRPQDPAYGAWGIGGDRRTPPYPGHVDLSMTRHVVEAFHAVGLPTPPSTRTFLERLRNPDGGSCFSTVVLDANKAGEKVSYGTATADAWRCLPNPSAESWLRGRHRPDATPGFENCSDKRWIQGLYYYYAAAYPFPDAALDDHLLQTQNRDGSWRNPQPLVKEDDPLIATSFALTALSK